MPIDPSPSPAAGTDEPLASVCSQGGSADPLGTDTVPQQGQKFCLIETKGKLVKEAGGSQEQRYRADGGEQQGV